MIYMYSMHIRNADIVRICILFNFFFSVYLFYTPKEIFIRRIKIVIVKLN